MHDGEGGCNEDEEGESERFHEADEKTDMKRKVRTKSTSLLNGYKASTNQWLRIIADTLSAMCRLCADMYLS